MIEEVLAANGVPDRHRTFVLDEIKTNRYFRRIMIIGYLGKRQHWTPERTATEQLRETYAQYEREKHAT